MGWRELARAHTRVCEGSPGACSARARGRTERGNEGWPGWQAAAACNEARAVEMWRPTGGLRSSGAGVWRGIPAGGGTGTSRAGGVGRSWAAVEQKKISSGHEDRAS